MCIKWCQGCNIAVSTVSHPQLLSTRAALKVQVTRHALSTEALAVFSNTEGKVK